MIPSELAAFLDSLGLKQTSQVAAALDDVGIETTEGWLALTDGEFDEAMAELKEAHVKLGDRQKLRLARSQSATHKSPSAPEPRGLGTVDAPVHALLPASRNVDNARPWATPSMHAAITGATSGPWMCLTKIKGLATSALLGGSEHAKASDVTTAEADEVAVRAIWELICAAGGENVHLEEQFELVHAKIVRDSHRAIQFTNKIKDLETKYTGLSGGDAAHPFSIPSTSQKQWREEIGKYFAPNFRALSGA